MHNFAVKRRKRPLNQHPRPPSAFADTTGREAPGQKGPDPKDLIDPLPHITNNHPQAEADAEATETFEHISCQHNRGRRGSPY